MAASKTTVDVQPLDVYQGLKMIWQQKVDDADVRTAFRTIMRTLNDAQVPIVVVVDLRADPKFPLRATLEEGRGPYKHPMLEEWLIIGSNWTARAIERTLTSLTGRKNVRWFNTEAEVMDYLSRKQATKPEKME